MKNLIEDFDVTLLKEYFKNKKTFTRQELVKFFTSVLDNKNKNSIDWIIYNLKKNGILINESRAVYSIAGTEMEKNKEFIVIDIDIAESTSHDSKELRKSLEEKVDSINNVLSKEYNLDRKYFISQGDEIQIFYPIENGFSKILLLTLSALSPLKVRYAVSIGKYDDIEKVNSWEMNGSIFWNARDALTEIKELKEYEGRIVTGSQKTDLIINNLLSLINLSLGKVTVKQWEAINFELSLYPREMMEEVLNISKTGFYERLAASNLKQILQSLDAIFEIIQERRVIG